MLKVKVIWESKIALGLGCRTGQDTFEINTLTAKDGDFRLYRFIV